MKKSIIIVVLFSILGLSGCSLWEHDLSESNEAVLAEYSADLLLQHDQSYTGGLLDRDDLITLTPVPTEVPITSTPTAAPTDSTEDSSNTNEPTGTGNDTVSNTDLSSILGNDAIETTYLGYEFYDSYTVGESSRIEPYSSSNQLLIVSLQVKNTSDQQQSVDILPIGMAYHLDVDSKGYYVPNTSILLNDFQYLNVLLDPLASQEAVLVFEVPKDFSPTTMSLFMIKDSQTVIFKMK